MAYDSWKLSACLWYLFFFGSEVCIWPFISVLLKESPASLSTEDIGIISACRLWANIIGAPLFTALADRYDSHLMTTLILLLACNAIRLLLPLCSTFSSLLVVVVSAEVLNAPIYSLADAQVTKHCSMKGEYARYRLYGSIGWGIFSVIAGAAIDKFGMSSAFLLNISLLLPVLWLTFRLFQPQTPIDPKDSQDLDLPKESTVAKSAEQLSFVQKILMLSSPQCLVFLFTVTVCGLGVGFIDSFLFLLLKEEGASDLLLGLTITVTCIAAVPVYLLQSRMIAFFNGPDLLLDLALLTYIIRMLFYSLLPSLHSPWWVLLIEILHGLTFPCAWGGGTEVAKALSPLGLEATTQGAFQAAFLGLGPGIGSLEGGFVAARFGFGALFFQGAMMVLGGWGVARGLRALVSAAVRSRERSIKNRSSYELVALSISD